MSFRMCVSVSYLIWIYVTNTGYFENISVAGSNRWIERPMFIEENLPSSQTTAADYWTQMETEHSTAQWFIEWRALEELN